MSFLFHGPHETAHSRGVRAAGPFHFTDPVKPTQKDCLRIDNNSNNPPISRIGSSFLFHGPLETATSTECLSLSFMFHGPRKNAAWKVCLGLSFLFHGPRQTHRRTIFLACLSVERTPPNSHSKHDTPPAHCVLACLLPLQGPTRFHRRLVPLASLSVSLTMSNRTHKD